MTETKFTPGPWKTERGTGHHAGHVVVTAPGMPSHSPMAHVPAWDEPEASADAALIAAAPDLYAACVLMLDYIRLDQEGKPRPVNYMLGEIHAALSKARGES